MANAVGNMAPVLNNTNPLIDLRQRFDEFYHVRTAEWSGFYPMDLHMTTQTISDGYRDTIEQVCPRRKNHRAQGDTEEPIAHVDVDFKLPKGFGYGGYEL